MTKPSLTTNAWLRYGLIMRALRRARGARSLLEIGVGGGALGTRLASAYDYTGLEPDEVSHRIAAEHITPFGGRVIHGDISALEMNDKFDVVCAFEVLEHNEDDAATIDAWSGHVKDGGWLVISVPAFQRRYGAWDERAGHYRRYERHALQDLLSGHGFTDVDLCTYGFPFGYLLEAGRNVLANWKRPRGSMQDLTAASGRALQPPRLAGLLTWSIALPFRGLQRPFTGSHWGIGLVASARRDIAHA